MFGSGARYDAIEVRAADRHDAAFVAEHDRHLDPDAVADLIASGRVLVAAEGDSLVGWLRWGLFWDEIPFMNMLFVLAPGRRRGIGRRLVGAWEDDLRAADHRIAMTSTRADEEAQHFYRRQGWVDCGSLLLPGESLEIFFRKALESDA